MAQPATRSAVRYREWRPEDPLSEITALLHLAYGRLARMGFNYTATYQDDATTRERLAKGRAVLALAGPRIVGTVTLYPPEPGHQSRWYQEHDKFGQLAVHPEFQGQGIGDELVRLMEDGARGRGGTELALDTAAGADGLRRWYGHKGYRWVEQVQWPGKTYPSVILSKTLG